MKTNHHQEYTRLWNAALGDLQLQMAPSTFDTWMKGTQLLDVSDDGTFVIGAPTIYAVEWLQNRLAPLIAQTLERHVGKPVSLTFTLLKQNDTPPPESTEDFFTMPAPQPAAHPNGSKSPEQEEVLGDPLQPRYTFSTFIVGASNRLAHAAALAVAERPAQAYNPLFIYGGVGLGKTHLLHAIGHETRKKGLRTVYITSERFTNELIADIRTQNTEAFRQRYRNVDVLLIDDIQFIAGKESTQEEFFHTFNTLHAANKQIVLSSDRPPRAIVLLEERLRSRFEGGLVCDIAPPDLETRIAILQAKAETQPIRVPSQVIQLIAQRVQSNIRELEGALTRVVAYAQFGHQPLTVELTERVLRDILDRPTNIDLDMVIQETARHFGVSVEDLKGKSRRKEIALARQVAMYLAREETDAALAAIGAALGGRDHSTVLYGHEKIAKAIEADDQLRREVLTIRERLYNKS